jgi:3-hydroxyisobutyrate dehydrogenase
MGSQVFPTGPIGSGHAMKALNNYLSASGVVAACEALIVGRKFGLEPETMVDVLNASTGRNTATEVKMKQQIISEKFASGFAIGLMAKDLTIAEGLAEHLELNAPALAQMAALWREAAEKLGNDADHTAIFQFLSGTGSD